VLKNKIINNIEEPFKLKQNFLNSLYTFLGIIYIGIPISLLLLIRKEADGFALLTVLIFGVFATDTFSFVTGKLLGIHKLASTISPNKTWEGAIGGGVLGFISTICLINILDVFDNFKITVSFAFLLVISAQIGDLLESKFKRMAKVKDTSNIIPGHGGMLDRMDSIILSTVIVYPLIKWSIG
jgi:phosphatidate cytidylyltransferase